MTAFDPESSRLVVLVALVAITVAASVGAGASSCVQHGQADTNETRRRILDVEIPCTSGVGDEAALRDAVTDAIADNQSTHNLILGTKCTYTLTAGIEVTDEANLVITGSNSTITKAPGEFSMVFVEEFTYVRVYNVTFRGANISGDGGAIRNWGTLWAVNCTFTQNSTEGGGGAISNVFGTLNLVNSTVSANSSSGFAGGIAGAGATVNLTNTTVSGNQAPYGGGIAVLSGTLNLENSTVTGNTATYDGGGLYSANGMADLTDSMISSNAAGGQGGGTYNGVKSLMNGVRSLWYGNLATGNGGGIANADGFYGASIGVTRNRAVNGGAIWDTPGDRDVRLTLTQGYVQANTATAEGGGIWHMGNSPSRATVSGTRVSGNVPSNCMNVTGC